MGLVKGNSKNSGVNKEYCADETNNFLYVDGVKYEPHEVTNIVGMKHAYYNIPQAIQEDLRNAYRFSSFVFYADTDNITREFYRPTSMIISNDGIVIEDSTHDYCVVIGYY